MYPYKGRFFEMTHPKLSKIRGSQVVSRRDGMPIAHRCIGGVRDIYIASVPEGRQPAFRPDHGERSSGTGICCMSVFPPIHRWAIGVLSLPGQKNLPLKGGRGRGKGTALVSLFHSPIPCEVTPSTRNVKNLSAKTCEEPGRVNANTDVSGNSGYMLLTI